MDPRTKYKVDKYVSKLKNAQTPEEANMYQAKLRFYHRKNQAGGSWFGGEKPEEQKQPEESIKDLLNTLGDRIKRCDDALEKLESMNGRMSKIEQTLEINSKKEDQKEDQKTTEIIAELVNKIKRLEQEVKELKEKQPSQNSKQSGGSNDIVLDMSSDAGEEFSNSMFALFN
jgi:hypothetical protein